jgi:hypothetical protein
MPCGYRGRTHQPGRILKEKDGVWADVLVDELLGMYVEHGSGKLLREI